MISRLIVGLGVATLLLLGSSCSVTRKAGRVTGTTVGTTVEVVFTDQERALILSWFREHRGSLPPGFAKRDRLPPGLERQLQKRGTLPPGLQKRIQPLPLEIERQLRKLPVGYVRVVIGGSVILMNEGTKVVYDIIRNAVS